MNNEFYQRTLNEIIQQIETRKTHYSLKNIRQQITPLVEQMTDNDEEKEILLDRISRFHRQFWKSETEKMFVQGHYGDMYTEYERGTAYEVPYPEDAIDAGENEGFLLTIHNHTRESAFYPSGADLFPKYDEKYMVIVNAHGICIIKRTDNMYIPIKRLAKEIGIWKYKDIMKMADETPEGQRLNKLVKESNMTEEDFVDEYVKLESKIILDNADTLFYDLNDSLRRGTQFDWVSVHTVPLTVNYTLLKSDEQLKRG